MPDDPRVLLYRLSARSRRWRWPGTPDPRLGILHQLQPVATRDALPVLLGVVAEGGRVGAEATAVVATVLKRLSLAETVSLGPALQRASWRWDAPELWPWLQLDADTLRRQAPSSDLREPYFAVASVHPSGYVREAAVMELATASDADILPYLLARLNDWVLPVRERAEIAVRRWLVPERASAWVRVLPVLAGMGAQSRVDAADLSDRVLALLAGSPDADLLVAALTSQDLAVRRVAVRLAVAGPAPLARLAVRHARTDRDLVVRLTAVRAGGTSEAAELIAWLRDPAAVVRRAALLALVQRDDENAERALREALMDPQASVRRLARLHLTSRSSLTREALGDVYREALTSERTPVTARLIGALGGLGETGKPPDAVIARPMLDHASAKVRAAALAAVVALDAPGHADRIVASLDDASPRVVRVASAAVLAGIPGIDAEAVLRRVLDRPDSAGRHAVLRALFALPHWRALPYLLRGALSLDTRARCIDSLTRWLEADSRVFTSPTVEEARTARFALAQAANGLPETLADGVLQALDRRTA